MREEIGKCLHLSTRCRLPDRYGPLLQGTTERKWLIIQPGISVPYTELLSLSSDGSHTSGTRLMDPHGTTEGLHSVKPLTFIKL